MFDKMGLGAVLTLDSTQFVSGAARASTGFKGLTGQANLLQASMARMRAGVASIGRGLSTLTLMAAPIGLALGYGAKKAMDFEQAIADTAAIVRATPEDMKALTDEAIRLGIETKFTASDAAGAMELLGRAGFNTAQTLEGVGGVMAMAAAEGMDMASAAGIAATVIRGMGIPLTQTTHVADVLAEASARANTNIQELGEGFSYAAPAAHDLGLNLEETTTALSMLANVGLKGSQSGTALEAMLRGLRGVTDRSAEAMDELGVTVRNTDGTLRPLSEIITDMGAALDQYSKADQDYLLFRIMRTEGMRAFNALKSQGVPAFEALQAQLEASSEVTDEFGNKLGAAGLMAATKLNTTTGAITLLKSSIESMSIVMFKDFLKPAAFGLNAFITDFNRLIYSVKLLNEGVAESVIEEKYGKTFLELAQGIRDGMDNIRNGWAQAKSVLIEAGEWLGVTFGVASARDMARWVTTAVGVVAAVGSLSAVLKVFMMVGSAAFSIVSGFGSVLWGLGSALVSIGGIIASVLAPAFATIGEMIVMMGAGAALGTVAAVVGVVVAAVIVLGNAIGGLLDFFTAFYNAAAPGFESLGRILVNFGGWIWNVLTTAYDILAYIGQIIGEVISQFSWVGEAIGYIFSSIMGIFEPIANTLVSIGSTIISLILPALQLIWQFLQPIVSVLSRVAELIWNVIKVGFEVLLAPIRAVWDLLGYLYEALKPSAEVTEAMSMAWDAITGAVADLGAAIDTYVLQPLELALGWLKEIYKMMKGPTFTSGFGGIGARRATAREEATPMPVWGGEAASAAGRAAERASQTTPPRPEDGNPTIDNHVTVENNTNANIDGRCVSRSVSRTQAEMRDRAGMTDTPYQRRAAVVAYQTFAEEPVL